MVIVELLYNDDDDIDNYHDIVPELIAHCCFFFGSKQNSVSLMQK